MSSQSRIRAVFASFPIQKKRAVLSFFVLIWTAGLAQSADPDMSNVPDVLHGKRVLFAEHDAIMLLKSNNADGNIQASAIPLLSVAGDLYAKDGPVSFQKNFPTGATLAPLSYGSAAARLFNNNHDALIQIDAGIDGTFAWSVSIAPDPVGAQRYSPVKIPSSFAPGQPVEASDQNTYFTPYAQVAVGDFNGDGFKDVLLVYANQFASGHAQTGMLIGTAIDPNSPQSNLKFGPEMIQRCTASLCPLPVQVDAAKIAVGDFNNDGRDEFAVITRNNEVHLFGVNKSTLAITELTTAIPLPAAPDALVAGHFRNSDPKSQPIQNAELVALSASVEPGLLIETQFPISITPHTDGSIAVAAAFPDGGFGQQVSGNNVAGLREVETIFLEKIKTFAAAGPVDSLYGSNDQLVSVVTMRTLFGDPVYVLNKASFDSSFTPIWTPQYTGNAGCAFSMNTGNFDLNKLGPPNGAPNLQIEVFAGQSCDLTSTLSVQTWNFYASPSVYWSLLDTQTNGVQLSPVNGSIFSLTMITGDLQGRSVQLGAPEIVNIIDQVQPDLVLGLPPMHIDWLAAADAARAGQPCDGNAAFCTVNISFKPEAQPSVGAAFATAFNVSDSTKTAIQRKSTTSWGLAVKSTTEAKITYGDVLNNTTVDIKNTMQYAHDNTVAKEYNTYTGTTDTLAVKTGTSDLLFFTQRSHNVYSYPILGLKACPTNQPNCTQLQQQYVQFSVPDQIQHNLMGATTQDWYQPLQQPGNLFSYPVTQAQIQAQLPSSNLTVLSQFPACAAADSQGLSYSTQWNTGSGEAQTYGSTNSFSDELSISVSNSSGIKDVESGSFSQSLDVKGSTSLSQLNTSVQTTDATTGITVTKSQFTDGTSYQFGSYTYGLQNQTWQQIPLGQRVQTTGPLFVGFMATVASSNDAGVLPCFNSGNPAFWGAVYQKSDIGLSQPERWDYNNLKSQAIWNGPLTRNDPTWQRDVLSAPFYHMKGFFITDASDGQNGVMMASAKVGQALTLTARIYNFSVTATPANDLVHVRFYRQQRCGDVLCGDSTLIAETTLNSIPGFALGSASDQSQNDGSLPNWHLASVNFTPTTDLAGQDLAFWVVTWLESPDGKLEAEMPGHGLTSLPSSSYTNITQIPIEPYSNNVGLFGFSSQGLHIDVATLPGGPENGTNDVIGKVEDVSTSVAQQEVLSGERLKVNAYLQTGDAPATNVRIQYWDGNPAKGGILFDTQTVHRIEADTIFSHRALYQAESCGNHDFYTVVTQRGASPLTSSASARVTLDFVESVGSLIKATGQANLPKQQTLELRLILKAALLAFTQNTHQQGKELLRLYKQQLQSSDNAAVPGLLSQADVILGCS